MKGVTAVDKSKALQAVERHAKKARGGERTLKHSSAWRAHDQAIRGRRRVRKPRQRRSPQ
jgi:hypothetical protein